MYIAWTHDNVHNAHSLQFAQTTTTLTDNEAKKRRWIKIVAAHNFTLNAMQRMHAGSESMSIWWECECECEFNARIMTISYNRWLIWMHFQFANYYFILSIFVLTYFSLMSMRISAIFIWYVVMKKFLSCNAMQSSAAAIWIIRRITIDTLAARVHIIFSKNKETSTFAHPKLTRFHSV